MQAEGRVLELEKLKDCVMPIEGPPMESYQSKQDGLQVFDT